MPHLGHTWPPSNVRHNQRCDPSLKVCRTPFIHSSTQPPVSWSDVRMLSTQWVHTLAGSGADQMVCTCTLGCRCSIVARPFTILRTIGQFWMWLSYAFHWKLALLLAFVDS